MIGRKSILSQDQYQQLEHDIQEDPSKFNYRVWDGKTLAHHIRTKFNIDLSVRTCQNIFKRIGFSLIVPQIYPSKGIDNLEAQLRCVLYIYYCIQQNYCIAFQDECHFKLQTSTTRGWYRKGSKPKVKSYPGRQSSCFSGIVIPETGYLHIYRPERFTWDSFIESLRDFIKTAPLPDDRKVILFLDNAPWHKKALRIVQEENWPEYQDIRNALKLVNIPPYCPHLNPIEQVWRVTRREVTHNRFFANMEELEHSLNTYFADFTVPNEKLKSLCSYRWHDMAIKRISESFGPLLKAG